MLNLESSDQQTHDLPGSHTLYCDISGQLLKSQQKLPKLLGSLIIVTLHGPQ